MARPAGRTTQKKSILYPVDPAVDRTSLLSFQGAGAVLRREMDPASFAPRRQPLSRLALSDSTSNALQNARRHFEPGTSWLERSNRLAPGAGSCQHRSTVSSSFSSGYSAGYPAGAGGQARPQVHADEPPRQRIRLPPDQPAAPMRVPFGGGGNGSQ